MWWSQVPIQLPALSRGCHLITPRILQAVTEIQRIECGFLQLFLQHTSASLTLNENADPDVRGDLELSLNHLCPENLPYRHTCEGPDDMPAHVKASLLGASLQLPIQRGRLALGTWQGIYLCEHRDRAAGRRILATLYGQARER